MAKKVKSKNESKSKVASRKILFIFSSSLAFMNCHWNARTLFFNELASGWTYLIVDKWQATFLLEIYRLILPGQDQGWNVPVTLHLSFSSIWLTESNLLKGHNFLFHMKWSAYIRSIWRRHQKSNLYPPPRLLRIHFFHFHYLPTSQDKTLLIFLACILTFQLYSGIKLLCLSHDMF